MALSDQQVHALLDSAPDAVVIADEQGIIVFVNVHAEALFGYARQELIGDRIETLIPDRFRAIHPAHRSSFTATPCSRPMGSDLSLFARRRDGSEFPVEISLSPCPTDSGLLVSCAIRDITIHKQVEEKLRKAILRKDEFLATVVHELRNPLAPIKHAALLLNSLNLSDDQRHRGSEIISRQVTRMALMLDDLLDMSRSRLEKFILKKVPTALDAVIRSAVEVARSFIDAKRHTLNVELPLYSVKIEVDPLRLSQVFSNILINAAKYTDPNGKISVTAKLDSEYLSISIKDSGIGLSAEAIARVFDVFSQVDSGDDRSQGGLGIGLALVKRLAEMHGGSVEAHSAGLGAGSEFIVRLPASVVISRVGEELQQASVKPERRADEIYDREMYAGPTL